MCLVQAKKRLEAQGAVVDITLNRKIQGGGDNHILGFPSSGHAHNTTRSPPIITLSAQGYSQLAYTLG